MTSLKPLLFPFAVLVASLTLSGCQSAAPGETTAGSFSRYSLYLGGDIPAQYTDRTNPLPASAENIAAGAGLYQTHCSGCHGSTGRGDGQAGMQLIPPPANLAFTRMTPIANDKFLFWTISEGGQPLGTGMPAFGGMLQETEIWQIVHYVNDGF